VRKRGSKAGFQAIESKRSGNDMKKAFRFSLLDIMEPVIVLTAHFEQLF
jgi:hypothetical protein